MRCLDLMLRIINPEMDKKGKKKAEKVIRGDVWSARGNVDGEIDIWRKVQDGSIRETCHSLDQTRLLLVFSDSIASCSSGSYPGFRVVAHTPGHLRRPPNRYASTVYASLPSTISLTPASSRPPTQKVDVPGVPGAFMVLDVFTPGECEQIVKAAMGIGMEKDEAVQGSARFKSSVSPGSDDYHVGSHIPDPRSESRLAGGSRCARSLLSGPLAVCAPKCTPVRQGGRRRESQGHQREVQSVRVSSESDVPSGVVSFHATPS